MEEEKPQITTPEMVAVFMYALLLDGLSIIPGLGTVITILGLLTLGVWSWIRIGKLPLTKKLRRYITKRAFIFLIEALPIAQIFPGWTVMALLGFKGASIAGSTRSLLLATPILLSAFWGRSVLALELEYPPFLPLHEGLTLNRLVEYIFTTSFILGAIAAFISVVYAGFAYIISGANPNERQKALGRIRAVALGIAILLSSVALLTVINPNLRKIPPIVADTLGIEAPRDDFVPAPSDVNPNIGQNYEAVLLGQNIDEIDSILENLIGVTGSRGLLASIQTLMEECSAGLCTPGSVPFERLQELDCSYEICGPDENGGETCETIQETCSQCVPGRCTGTSCNGNPLSDRDSISRKIEDASEALQEIQQAITEAQSARSLAGNCNGQLFSCSAAQMLQIATSCSPSEDFYCVASNGATTRMVLPFSDVVNAELSAVNTLIEIAEGINAATCSNTTFTCPSEGCGAATGQCLPSETRSGCPQELFDEADELLVASNALKAHYEELMLLIQKADSLHQLAISSPGRILFQTCKETRAMLNALQQSGRYSDGRCEEGITCCPTDEVIQNISSCDPVDLFLCF